MNKLADLKDCILPPCSKQFCWDWFRSDLICVTTQVYFQKYILSDSGKFQILVMMKVRLSKLHVPTGRLYHVGSSQ